MLRSNLRRLNQQQEQSSLSEAVNTLSRQDDSSNNAVLGNSGDAGNNIAAQHVQIDHAESDLLQKPRHTQPQEVDSDSGWQESPFLNMTTGDAGFSVVTINSNRLNSDITIAILSCFLGFLSILIMIIAYKLWKQQQQQEIHATEQQQQQQQQQQHAELDDADLQERILRRYETIEHWLITKQALPVDDFCKRVVTDIIPQSLPHNNECEETTDQRHSCCANKALLMKKQNSTCAETDDECDSLFDEEEPECPICMSPLSGMVSWSANPSCNHVFHHQCLKEWLLRRTACPYCRETVLPCDESKDKTREQLQVLSTQYAGRSSTMFYCNATHIGLVTLPAAVRCTLTELRLLKVKIFDSVIYPDTLAEHRGELAAPDESNNKDVTVGGIEDASENPCELQSDLAIVEYPPSSTNNEGSLVHARVALSASRNQQDDDDSNEGGNSVDDMLQEVENMLLQTENDEEESSSEVRSREDNV